MPPALVVAATLLATAAASAPAHVHLAPGADPRTAMTVMWSSLTGAVGAVAYSASGPLDPSPTTLAVTATDNSYKNKNGLPNVFLAELVDLSPGTRYWYTVSVGAAMSAWFNFTTVSDTTPPVVIYWGDLGKDGGGQALPALEAEARAAGAGAPGAGTIAIHNGDFAYDLADDNGGRGASFMERFQAIASLLPVAVTIGNHELPPDEKNDKNASHFVNMLGKGMPGGTNGSYYSLNVGLMHMVFLSSEVYALGPYGGVTAAGQAAWLEADLAAVDRVATPWLIAVMPRPFFCSNNNSWCVGVGGSIAAACARRARGSARASRSPPRYPLPSPSPHPSTPTRPHFVLLRRCGAGAWQANPVRHALEPVFMRHGVDVVLSGHEHSVELTWPVANGTVTQTDYESPRAPVHIIDGAAGCNENKGECLNPMGPAAGAWSRARLAGDPEQVRLAANRPVVLGRWFLRACWVGRGCLSRDDGGCKGGRH